MAQIFISYRRVDSNAITSRIYDRFVAAFGKNNVFKDVDNIPLGRDFRGVLRVATAQCQVMIVVIGPDWVNAKDASGNRRLENPDDFVRIEVEAGLQRDEILVIPLLVEGAQMPSPMQLPDSMRELVYNNAFTIHDDPLFHRDMDTLICSVRGSLRQERGVPRSVLIGAAVVLLAAGTVSLPLFLSRQTPPFTPDITNTVSEPNTQAALISTATLPSETVDFAVLAQTYDAAQGQKQTAELSQATQTESAGQTQTAAQWTSTFTPQLTTTFEAFLTQRAAATEEALTANAALWTATPTPTYPNTATLRPSNTPTPIATSTPILLVDTTPILPNFYILHDVLRGIYANGVYSMGSRAAVFGSAGDSIFTVQGILTPFAVSGQYNLTPYGALQKIIDFFNAADLGGTTSFNRNSLAVNSNWTAQDLLNPLHADPSCKGEAPLTCELHQTHPSIMFVSIGTNDAHNGVDPNAFSTTLNQIVSTIVSNGTIPILLTVPDDGSTQTTEAINEAIIAVARQNNVPLLNAARALNELPNFNLSASPNGPSTLGNGATSDFGINALNLYLLGVLTDVRNIIFPDA